MKKLILAASVFLVLGLGASWAGGDEPDEREPSFWMKQKLKYSQQILNGLVTADFELIQQNASAMKGLNQIEYFVRRRPEGYRTQLRVFQFSVDELVRHAKDDNLDGATLAFTQMTISCVNCHKQLRAD